MTKKIRLIILSAILLFINIICYPQQVNSNSEKSNDSSFIPTLFNKKRIVAIGEATHNDHQEQIFKNKLIKNLILHYGYTVLFIENPASGAKLMNNYIQGVKDINIRDEMLATYKSHAYTYFLWKTNEFIGLLNWLKRYNDTTTKKKVILVGLDSLDKADKNNLTRDSSMAARVKVILSKYPHQKAIVLAHNVHISNVEVEEYHHSSMGSFLKKYFGNDYFTIGQLFGTGCYNAPIIIDYHQLEKSCVKYDISNLSNELSNQEQGHIILTATHPMLDKRRKIWSFGGSQYKIGEKAFVKVNLSKMFDAIVFHQHITPAENLYISGTYYINTKHLIDLNLKSTNNLKKVKDIYLNFHYNTTTRAILEIQLYNNMQFTDDIKDTLKVGNTDLRQQMPIKKPFNTMIVNLFLFKDGTITINTNTIKDDKGNIIVNNIFQKKYKMNISQNLNSPIKRKITYGKDSFTMQRYTEDKRQDKGDRQSNQ